MFTKTPTVHSFSVNDIPKAARFYGDTLGLDVSESIMGNIEITFGDGSKAFVYEKSNHEPASFTILNFISEDIEATVDDLNSRGVVTKIYSDDEIPDLHNDAKGIVRGEDGQPQIAWFKDPAGNVLAVMASDPEVWGTEE